MTRTFVIPKIESIVNIIYVLSLVFLILKCKYDPLVIDFCIKRLKYQVFQRRKVKFRLRINIQSILTYDLFAKEVVKSRIQK